MSNSIRSILPANAPTFDRIECRVKDLQATVVTKGQRKVITHITVDGRVMECTERFVTSITSRYGFGNNIFKLFTPEETFERISQCYEKDKLVATVEKSDKGERIIGSCSPATVRVNHDDYLGIMQQYGLDISTTDYGNGPHQVRRGNSLRQLAQSSGGDIANMPVVSYDTGLIRSIHKPRHDPGFTIAGDVFNNRFVIDTPIDGYGKPSVYLMILRQVCTNGAIGYSRMFKADLALGKKEDSYDYAFARAIEGYNNEEGFGALRQRFESAAKSWASLNEANKIYTLLVRLNHRGELVEDSPYKSNVIKRMGSDGASLMDRRGMGNSEEHESNIIQSFNDLCDEVNKRYGMANLGALGIKRQRHLPCGCSMYEMLNFLSEVATHHSTPAGNRQIQAMIGELVGDVSGFDLEGTKEKFPDWKQFMVADKSANEAIHAAKSKRN